MRSQPPRHCYAQTRNVCIYYLIACTSHMHMHTLPPAGPVACVLGQHVKGRQSQVQTTWHPQRKGHHAHHTYRPTCAHTLTHSPTHPPRRNTDRSSKLTSCRFWRCSAPSKSHKRLARPALRAYKNAFSFPHNSPRRVEGWRCVVSVCVWAGGVSNEEG